jgi:short-subunit dehydrogenase
MDFTNKIVLITGASSGIGRETAFAFAQRGAIPVVVARREENLKQLTATLKKYTADASYIAGDLAVKEFAYHIVDECIKRYGKLDILVNNAAIPMHKLLYKITAEEAEEVIRVNFLACLWTCFAAIPYMLKQSGGTIVNVSSFASKIPPTHETIYVASKCAMNGFTRGLWNDLKGSGIHAVLLHPGPIDTEIWQKLDQPSAYKDVFFPPALVAEELLRAVRKKKYEVIVPRRNFKLTLARIMNVLAPSLVRAGTAKMDPVGKDNLQLARHYLGEEKKRMGDWQHVLN